MGLNILLVNPNRFKSPPVIPIGSPIIVGAARDRVVKVWMDFLTYMELEGAFVKSKKK